MKVLFIRSVPAAAAAPVLCWLRAQIPAATITVLTSTSGRDLLERTGTVDGVVVHDTRRITVASAGPGRLLSLVRQRFDLVVVPHMGDRRSFAKVAQPP